MKPKEFEIDKGEYAVVVTYTNHDDVSGTDEEKKDKTHARPRPACYQAIADVALRAREFWNFGDLKPLLRKVGFTESNEGRFVRLTFKTLDGIGLYPPRLNREKVNLPSTGDPDPDNPKNILIDAVDLLENRISEYLNGDREQPELPPAKEEPSEPGLFGKVFTKGKRKRAPAAV